MKKLLLVFVAALLFTSIVYAQSNSDKGKSDKNKGEVTKTCTKETVTTPVGSVSTEKCETKKTTETTVCVTGGGTVAGTGASVSKCVTVTKEKESSATKSDSKEKKTK